MCVCVEILSPVSFRRICPSYCGTCRTLAKLFFGGHASLPLESPRTPSGLRPCPLPTLDAPIAPAAPFRYVIFEWTVIGSGVGTPEGQDRMGWSCGFGSSSIGNLSKLSIHAFRELCCCSEAWHSCVGGLA
jgi:hypothetical protein